MLTVLSPAKKLLTNFKPYLDETTEPLLRKGSVQLVRLMKTKTVEQVAALMDLSSDLAKLNYQRYQSYNLRENTVEQSYPALFLFQGDVYQGLQAASWDNAAVNYSQGHLRILSGLYGLLRPLDRIQPYRLEMGVHLANDKGSNLYDFWRETVTKALHQQLKEQTNPVLINLASTEYFKVINEKKLGFPIVTINFYEHRNNEVKMVGIYAKKARGAMAKFMMQNKVDTLEHIKDFSDLGYRFNKETSSTNHLDFIRDAITK